MNKEEWLKHKKLLEKDLKEKDKLIEKYRQALLSSNERIQKMTNNLEEGLSLLKGIHRNLIPVDLPDIPYFEFSWKFIPTSVGISGDFFDVVKIKDSLNFAIIISNCNSYAISSLFLSSFLKSSQAMQEPTNSKDFICHIVKQLPDSFLKSKEINVFYAIVDRKKFTLNYCMVGDIFGAIQRRDGELSVFKPCAKSLPSNTKNLDYEEISLNPKDTLLFCSPGIKNAQNKKGEIFGEDNILKAFKESQAEGALGIRQNILFQCEKFDQSIESQNDKTILVTGVKEKVLKLQK